MKGLLSTGPARTTSLPARVHPSAANISESLDHLQAWSAAAADAQSCTTAQVCSGLADLSALCTSVDELLHLPTSQRALARGCGDPCVEEALDGYIQLLDACTAARDALLDTKEHATAIHSAIRRRGADTSAVLRCVKEHVRDRKKARKAIVASIKQLKPDVPSQHHQHGKDIEESQELQILVETLRKARVTAAKVLGSLLKVVAVVPTHRNGSRWELLFSRVRRSAVASKQQGEGGESISDVGLTDALVAQLRSGKEGGDSRPEVVLTMQTRLEALEARVDQLESAVDRVYVGLMRNRVTLLNIISP